MNFRAFALLLTLLAVLAPESDAQSNRYWTRRNGNNLWDSNEAQPGGPSTTNWFGNVLPASGDFLNFDPDNLVTVGYVIDLTGNRSAGGVFFGSADSGSHTFILGNTVGAHTLTVGGGTASNNISIFSTPTTQGVFKCNLHMNDTSGDNEFEFRIQASPLTVEGTLSGSNNVLIRAGGSGGSTLYLKGANTCTGNFIVGSEITLDIANSSGSATGSGNVLLQNFAKLTGTGSLSGAVTVENGGQIQPGNSIGTLAVGSIPSMSGTYQCEVNATTADRLNIGGTFNAGGTLQFNLLATPTRPSYTILTAGQINGQFATVTNRPIGYNLVYTATTITLERQSTIYVRAGAGGNGSGVDWTNAVPKLQDALAAAMPGDEIRIAAGTYYPDEGVGRTDGDRNSTFQLISGVTLLGGYPAGGGTDRDPSANPTYLSGDLNKNDGSQFANSSDNAYHVVTGSNADATAIVDGLNIVAGNATGTLLAGTGGGLFCSVGSPTFTDCGFLRNQAAQDGGGIYLFDSATVFTNCRFQGNKASTSGGAVVSTGASPSFVNCSFVSNFANDQGGAAMVYEPIGANPAFTNCSFQGNDAGIYGGAVAAYEVTVSFKNSIIWNNRANGSTNSTLSSIHWVAFPPTFSHCLVENWTTAQMGGSGNLDGTDPSNNPDFVAPSDLASNPFSDGDLRLRPASPAIETGLNASNLTTVDLGGNPRFIDGDSDGTATIDLGAYEGPTYSAAYTQWIQGFFPGETAPAIIGPAADPGGNGMNNALSFISNTSPLATVPVQPLNIVEQDGDLAFVLPGGNSDWEEFDAYMEYSFDLENFERVLIDPALGLVFGDEIEPGVLYNQGWAAACGLQVDKTIHPKIFVRLSADIPGAGE